MQLFIQLINDRLLLYTLWNRDDGLLFTSTITMRCFFGLEKNGNNLIAVIFSFKFSTSSFGSSHAIE